MIPRLKPTIGIGELRAAMRPLGTRNDVAAFERKFARVMGQHYAIAFPYGRTGIIFLLEALGLKEKEIICPAYTCIVVPHAIVYSGNKPVFVDCKPGEFNMDLDQVEKAITKNTGAIIATSVFGYPVDLDRLEEIRIKHPHVHIIQDCAHSFSARWKGRAVQRDGVAAVFGLNISKILCSVFGGMITTDDSSLRERLVQLRKSRLIAPTFAKSFRRFLYLTTVYPTFWGPVYGLINRLERFGLLDRFTKYYNETEIDMPSDYLTGLTKLEARVGEVNLKRYDRILQNRQEAAAYYFNFLAEDETGLRLPPEVEGASYSDFVVRVENREQWLQKGIRNGVQLGWLIEYNIPEMKAYGCHEPADYPVAAEYARSTINLPVWGGKSLAQRVVIELGFPPRRKDGCRFE